MICTIGNFQWATLVLCNNKSSIMAIWCGILQEARGPGLWNRYVPFSCTIEDAAPGGLHDYGVELYKKMEEQGYGTGMHLSHVLLNMQHKEDSMLMV